MLDLWAKHQNEMQVLSLLFTHRGGWNTKLWNVEIKEIHLLLTDGCCVVVSWSLEGWEWEWECFSVFITGSSFKTTRKFFLWIWYILWMRVRVTDFTVFIRCVFLEKFNTPPGVSNIVDRGRVCGTKSSLLHWHCETVMNSCGSLNLVLFPASLLTVYIAVTVLPS